jgi:uncharacterized membrane protein
MREMQETLHPMLVHFHIGLLATASVFELLGVWRRHAGLRQAAFYMLIVGLLGLLVSVPSGLWAAQEQAAGAQRLVALHRDIGLAATVLFAVVVGLRTALARREKPGPALAWTYGVLLPVAVAFLAVTGYYGGRIVYG